MRMKSMIFGAAICAGAAGTAYAQQQLIHHVGDRWVFVVSDSNLVDPSLIGQKVYFPVTTSRHVGVRVFVGEAAVCTGRYSGSVSAGLGSVEGRVIRLEQSDATFKNSHGEVYRRPTRVFLLEECRFGPVDLNAVPNTLAADREAHKVRDDEELDAITQDFLRSEEEACLRILAKRNAAPTPQAKRTYCP